MAFNDAERDLLLAALFELRITHAEDTDKGAQIEALVVKLGGDLDTALFGAYRHSADWRRGPVPDYRVRRERRGPTHPLQIGHSVRVPTTCLPIGAPLGVAPESI